MASDVEFRRNRLGRCLSVDLLGDQDGRHMPGGIAAVLATVHLASGVGQMSEVRSGHGCRDWVHTGMSVEVNRQEAGAEV